MEHLNESFLSVEEHITNAIRKLGIHAMGIDEEAVRREAMDELAMALQCLKTGEREELEAEGSTAELGEGNASPSRGRNLPHPEPAEKQPEPPSGGEPYKAFHSEKELVEFVLQTVNRVNRSAHDLAIEKSKRDMQDFREKEALFQELMPFGHTTVDLDYLRDAHSQACYILERLPDVDSGMELEAELNKAAIRLYSRLCLMLPVDESEDIDTSDNDRTEGAQVAEKGSERTQHAVEGCADGAHPAKSSQFYVEHTSAQEGAVE